MNSAVGVIIVISCGFWFKVRHFVDDGVVIGDVSTIIRYVTRK